VRSFKHATRTAPAARAQARCIHRSAVASQLSEDQLAMLNEEREYMPYDVVIVGAGPAGLAAGLRIKQLGEEQGVDYSVCILEKAAELGAHILSGNVFEPRALDELLPGWREDEGCPINTPVNSDEFLVLSETGSVPIPNILLPPTLHNDGNYIISLSQLVVWLGDKAEEAGIDILPGFAASEMIYDEAGAVRGVATRDVGIGKDGAPKGSFARGTEIRARQTILTEGCRGSCSEEVMKTFGLRDHENVAETFTGTVSTKVEPQSYGIGVKEVWEIPEDKCKPGLVQHTLGWPLQSSLFSKTFGGSFLYHMAPNKILIGFVVGLDYENPYLSPYQEFQRWKHHPDVAKHLEGGECVQYGARCLNEGGFHAIPKLTFPGGAMAGCSAGFLNSIKIKGSHTALKTGMLAGEEIFAALHASGEEPVAETFEIPDVPAMEVTSYQTAVEESWVMEELKEVRNCHASFHWGTVPGMIYTGISTLFLKGREPWSLRNDSPDSAKTGVAAGIPGAKHEPITYPKPDGELSFDLLTNLARSGTNHEGDQPAHLRIKEDKAEVPAGVSLNVYAGPEQRFCPAKVYEYDDKGELVINAQNCLHCKACSIKMPHEYIDWTVPEGGGGPAYSLM